MVLDVLGEPPTVTVIVPVGSSLICANESPVLKPRIHAAVAAAGYCANRIEPGFLFELLKPRK